MPPPDPAPTAAGLRHTAGTVLQDVRHTFRLMRRDPAFTLAAMATLALGIGLNVAIFSVAYGVLWRPLPYPDAHRLVLVTSAQQTTSGLRTFSTWAPVTFDGLHTRLSTFESLAAYAATDVQLSGHGEPLQVSGLEVSANFFDTLGVHILHGRSFVATDPARDEGSVVISDRLWRSSFGADPAIVGGSLTIDNVARAVVGVLPPEVGFSPVVGAGAQSPADVYVSKRWSPTAGQGASLFLLGRLTPGTTTSQAEAELTPLVNDPAIASTGALTEAGTFDAQARTIARVTELQEYGTRAVRPVLLMLVGAVSFVLLIAWVNVANLQMARLVARRGELSVRLALGAGRVRLVRQLLTEAAVVSLAGAALGTLLAVLTMKLTLPFVPAELLPRTGIALDGAAMGFCLCLSLIAALVVGLIPALRLGSSAFSEARALLASETRTAGDRQGERLRTGLVAVQLAMTMVLLVGAGLLVHSFIRLTSTSTGFASANEAGVVQTIRVTLPERLAGEPGRMQAFTRDVLERVKYLPGVAGASAINSAPFGMMFIQGAFEMEGHAEPTISAGMPRIEPGYFETMGIPLLAGREFTSDDTPVSPGVAIVSERVAREFFPGGAADALGRRLRIGLMSADGDWLTIVGVVADIRQRGLDEDVKPMIYTAYQQERATPFLLRFVSFVARTSEPAVVAERMRAEIHRIAPDLPIAGINTMDDAVATSVAAPMFRTLLAGLFAVAAMLIATCGLYGLMAYAVTQRRREIGVRVALGATRGHVVRLVLAHALRVVVIGVVAGIVVSAGVTRVLQTFLFGVTPTEPIVFGAVTMVLFAVGLLAAWLPARRAARVDPWTALRAG